MSEMKRVFTIPTIIVDQDEDAIITSRTVDRWEICPRKEMEDDGKEFAGFLYNNTVGSFTDGIMKEYIRLYGHSKFKKEFMNEE